MARQYSLSSGQYPPTRFRSLALERLENRALLAGDIDVDFRLAITSLAGAPVTAVSPGEHFLLKAYTTDVRANPQGVFAAFLDIDYSGQLVHVANNSANFLPTVTWAENFPWIHTGSDAASRLEEMGCVNGDIFSPPGGAEHFLFAVEFVASAPGLASFAADPADLKPAHDVLLYGLNDTVPVSRIHFGSAQVAIKGPVPGFGLEGDNTEAGNNLNGLQGAPASAVPSTTLGSLVGLPFVVSMTESAADVASLKRVETLLVEPLLSSPFAAIDSVFAQQLWTQR